jgi:epoxyqueuosine reductase QueG
MIGCRMEYEKMRHVPPTVEDPQSAVEVAEKYNQVDRVAGRLANWIRSQGWYAENQGGPNSGKMVMIPAALACGFGELGKHGSIINRELGSLIRLSCVRTDLPLIADDPDIFGADDFCTQCQVCTRACPVDAITPERQLVRGETKWYVDFDKCVPYFNENYACGICIAVCPWSRPGVAPKLAEKMTRRKQRLVNKDKSPLKGTVK